jgi:hypothetical protein
MKRHLRRSWFMLLALTGWNGSFPAHDAHAALPPTQETMELRDRVNAVRAQLRDAGMQIDDAHVTEPHKLAQWFNFPNFPNFPNWRNWGNFPNFPNFPNWR